MCVHMIILICFNPLKTAFSFYELKTTLLEILVVTKKKMLIGVLYLLGSPLYLICAISKKA